MKEEPRSIGALLVGDHLTTRIKVRKLAVSEVPLLLLRSIREVALVLGHGRIVRNFEVVNLMQGRRERVLALWFHFSAHGKVSLRQLFLDGLDVLTREHAGVAERPVWDEIFHLAVHLPTEKLDAQNELLAIKFFASRVVTGIADASLIRAKIEI